MRVGQFHKLVQDFQISAYMCACVYTGSVRFAGLFAGQKLLGLNPAKFPAKIPGKKQYQEPRTNPNSDYHHNIPPSSAPEFFARPIND